MDSRIEVILESILQEQQRTNQILMMLVEAMAEDQENPDAEPVLYMDGSSVDG